MPIETRRQPMNFIAAPKKTTSTGLMNRFQPLNMEVTDGDSNDDDHGSKENTFDSGLAACDEGIIT
jgi:hypothetical protein